MQSDSTAGYAAIRTGQKPKGAVAVQKDRQEPQAGHKTQSLADCARSRGVHTDERRQGLSPSGALPGPYPSPA